MAKQASFSSDHFRVRDDNGTEYVQTSFHTGKPITRETADDILAGQHLKRDEEWRRAGDRHEARVIPFDDE